MRLVIAACVWLIYIAPAIAQPVIAGAIESPYTSVQRAAADSAAVPLAVQPYTRYLSLYHIPSATERRRLAAVVSFVANSLSRERSLKIPVALPKEDNPWLLRIDCRDYTWSAKSWDDLAEKGSGPTPRGDPYFHTAVTQDEIEYEEKQVVVGYDNFRRPQYEVQQVESGRRRVKTVASAPWVALDGGKAISSLITATRTKNPILRADWFIVYATWAPRYYDFLGLGKTEADFDILALAEPTKGKKQEIRGAVTLSDVASHNRFLLREPTLSGVVGGSKWTSYDFLDSVDEKDVLLNLFNDKPDAKEIIATLRNGLSAYFVVNAEGKRLDVADPNIAQDYVTPLKDKQIWVARNCMMCHAAVKGFRPIRDSIREMSRDKLALLIADEKLYRRVTDQISVDIAEVVAYDQAFYAKAVMAACGLTPAELSAAMSEYTHQHLDVSLTTVTIAQEAGCDVKTIDEALRKGVNLDPRLVGRLQQPPQLVRRDQWERSAFPNLMIYLLGQSKGK